jgi:type VI secretion system secreted protein VgrG
MNFVMRLMEHEGIYFHFEHASGTHTLVMSDDVTCHSALPGKSSIKYFGIDAATVATEEHFNSWQIREEVNPGEYISDDYDFEKPRADLTTKRKNPLGHSNDSWERYMWPGGYTEVGDGESYAGVRLDSLESEHERGQGHTTVRTMAPGYLFNLERCPRADQNREYLAVGATYYFRNNARMSAGSGEGDSDWGINVTSQPTSVPYRPQRLTSKPLTHGPQTAVVVGPKGEEIYTDKYGRVKVQFHWDRYGANDENSSCWIRVSHPWAGTNYGAIHIPRIGQEVIVDFIGGDPDYPMITGRVYNADQMPPWGLPDNKTQSGILTRSSKGGAPGAGMKAAPGDANAIRFEDKKNEEQLWFHAQKDQLTEVENDETKWVGRDRRKTIDRDELNHIKRDRTETVDRNETITVHGWRDEEVDKDETIRIHQNRTETVDLDEKVTVHKNQTFTVDLNRTKKVGKNEVDKIGKNWSIKVGKFKTETITLASMQNVGLAKMVNVGAGYNLNVGAVMATVVGMSQFEQIGKSKSVNVGKTFKLEAGDSIELICGASVLVMKKDGSITINGKDIDVVGSKHIGLDSKRIDLN